MADANKDEVDKCKQIAQKAIAEGDAVKAVRFLQKAKRMCPSDASIDDLIAAAEASEGSSGQAPTTGTDSAPEGPRFRSAPGRETNVACSYFWCFQGSAPDEGRSSVHWRTNARGAENPSNQGLL